MDQCDGSPQAQSSRLPRLLTPHPRNPSLIAADYTDGSCQRLIYEAGYDAARYLFKCDAIDCCYEEEEDGPLEYQIPNVHNDPLCKVDNLGKENITLFDGTSHEADRWAWKFTLQHWTAHTEEKPWGTALLRWTTSVGSYGTFTNEYSNYTAVPDSQAAAFRASFAAPAHCPISCNALHAEGKLSDRSLRFLRADRGAKHRPTARA